MGALLALVEPEVLARPAFMHRRFWWGLLSLGVPLALVYVSMSGSRAAWLQTVKFLLVGLCYFSFLGLAITAGQRSLLTRVFASGPMRFLGGISYGLYVYHGACFAWFDRLVPNRHPMLMLPLAFGCSILVAYLSFRFIETPFLGLKRHFSGGTKTTAAKSEPVLADASSG